MIITFMTSLFSDQYLLITRPFHQKHGDHVAVVSTHNVNKDSISTGSFANASVLLYHAPSLVYKIQIHAIVFALRSTTVDHCRSGTLASVSVSIDGSFASRLDIPTMRAVNASVRQYRVSHRLSLIQPHVSVNALRILSVYLGTISMKLLVSVCLGLIINPHLNAKLTIRLQEFCYACAIKTFIANIQLSICMHVYRLRVTNLLCKLAML